jgi:hypothetical protein
MKTITQRKLVEQTGSEGPRHDPYGWTERTVMLNGVTYRLRSGALGYDRLSVNGVVIVESYDNSAQVNEAEHEFEVRTGMTVAEFDKYCARIHHDDLEDPMGPASWYV